MGILSECIWGNLQLVTLLILIISILWDKLVILNLLTQVKNIKKDLSKKIERSFFMFFIELTV